MDIHSIVIMLSEQFGGPDPKERLRRQKASEAREQQAKDIVDGVFRIGGWHDAEHFVMEGRRHIDEMFVKKYPSARFDPDLEDTVVHLSHPSGWSGIHYGAHMELVPPGHTAPVDMINFTDHESSKGIFDDPDAHWPEESTLPHHLDAWVKDNAQYYEGHY